MERGGGGGGGSYRDGPGSHAFQHQKREYKRVRPTHM